MQSYMDAEIRGIMAQYMPLESQPPNTSGHHMDIWVKLSTQAKRLSLFLWVASFKFPCKWINGLDTTLEKRKKPQTEISVPALFVRNVDLQMESPFCLHITLTM